MYAVIANKITEKTIVYKTFNKDLATTFFNNAANKMASINYRDTESIELLEVQNKSNSDIATEGKSGLFGQTGDRLINGLQILSIIKKHEF